MHGVTSWLGLMLIATACLAAFGSRVVYHTDAGLPEELEVMEVLLGEQPAVKRSGSTLWFGPRLGRRKRDVAPARGKRDADENAILAKEEIYRLAQGGPWDLVALRGGKRRGVNFTPRLGRDSEEDTDNFVDERFGYGRTPTRSGGGGGSGGGGQVTSGVGSNFTPRLGRLAPLDSH